MNYPAVHQDREVGEAEEVELDETQVFQVRLLVLRDQPRIVGVFVVAQLQRHRLVERLARDNDARRVDAGAAHRALQVARQIHQLAHWRADVVELLQLAHVIQRAA